MRRDRTETTRDILDLCRNIRKKTEIMRLANISFMSLHTYVDPLVRDGYLVEVPQAGSRTKVKWMTTANGRMLLGDIISVLEKIKR